MIEEGERIKFRLALAQGWIDPDAMVDAMPASLWRRWCEYFVAEPFGPKQDDLRAGVLAALLANQWNDGKRKPAQPGDFFPSLKDRRKPHFDSPEGQDQLARMWAMATGGKIIDPAAQAK